ncbi:hypothetical protein [Actinoplanes xinjiangensis]|uniref:hypothetical protein n=1 Tax=Actinoplanes xinjiangensis TaxID=512350 RepID=UPI001A3F1850|nr:hypothetical protein [Actinoplanes xinjiangensis]GIF40229.1 hypothetical protein Axi01nite_45400 [Actinoplanes xinjiangensis]
MRLTGILVPGRLYTTAGTLFDLADHILTGHGDAAEHITWLAPDGLLDVDPEPFVRVHTEAALHRHRGLPSSRTLGEVHNGTIHRSRESARGLVPSRLLKRPPG